MAEPEATDSETSRSRWAFLAEASRCLADSLDYETTLETTAALAIPILGSWSIVDLTEPGGTVRRLAIVHPDPDKEAIARELMAGWPPLRDDPMGVSAVARTGHSELIREITDPLLVEVARTEENLDRLRTLGMRSVITVPMRARGRILGAMTFVSSSESRLFTDSDLSLAEDLANRCGLAIDNARLHQAARTLVETERNRLRIETADQVKAEFLRTASHEMRTPLNVMAGYLELLAMEVAGPLTRRQRHYVERLRAGEEQLLRIVEDMLNFVRLHEREIVYDLVDIGLTGVVEDVTDAYAEGLIEKGIELHTRCDPAVRAHADPAKVWQIMMNLLSNARKFTEPRGSVTIACTMRDDRPTVEVIDSGCGIPKEKWESIFLPFVQGDAALTRPAQGMGLGLSISRQLARDMGGDLVATSVVGEGCTFTLTLAPQQKG
ncbi:MAG TPA: HAMP domain-containing sensor histidine kinase [Longimicrobiaceae bacterium]|nr:HAMP domain-containing sensor histidine kinase [Longimicrobiaceae bacterium]